MHRYIIKRLFMLIPVLIGVSLVVFVLMDIVPGDPVDMIVSEDATEEQRAEVRAELGLDKPLLERYAVYMLGLLKGDMGTSYVSNKDVFQTYMDKFPNTLVLAVASIIVAVGLSIPLGVLAATHQNTLLDSGSSVLAILGLSMPNFWLGLLLIIAFSNKLPWFPSGGFDGFRSIILPAITEGTGLMALIMRTTRSSMLEVIRQDYITTARAKGVSERKVIYNHAFRNALIPVVTAAGMNFAYVLGGPVLTETVFSWPGVGRLVVDSLNSHDIPMVTGCMVLTTLIVSIVNLLVDIFYAYIDPRIKAQYAK